MRLPAIWMSASSSSNVSARSYATIVASALPSLDAVSDSLYAALEAAGNRPVRALQRLRALLLDAEQAELLKANPGDAGLLVERQQLFTWIFRLSVDAERRLILELVAADVLGIPILWVLAPRCRAFETGADGKFTFDITVDLPIFGRLIRYWGVMDLPAGDGRV